MKDTSLATRYRPQTLDDVVEQQVVVKTLKRQLESGKIKQAQLFCGCYGSGKTSIARIFAKEVNGSMIECNERDSATYNSVEDVRSMLDDLMFAPIGAKYKIYILDECHLLSNSAWSALLKLLEEPPETAMIILCTTDPQKVLPAVMSRVYRFDFKPITYKGVLDRLKYVMDSELNGENISGVSRYDMEALEYIAKTCKGSMRSALTALDKCIAYDPEVTEQNVLAVLDVLDFGTMFDLLDIIQNKEESKLSGMLGFVQSKSIDLKIMIRDLMSVVLDVTKYQLQGGMYNIDFVPMSYEHRMQRFSDKEFLKKLLKVLMQLSTDLKWDNNPKVLIEATLLTEFFN